MYVYVAKVKQGDNFSIRVFRTKSSATKAIKQAQEEMYQASVYAETHDTYQDANGYDVTIKADNTTGHKKCTATIGDTTMYYVVSYSKATKEDYYKTLAGYVKKVAVEQ